MSPPADHLFDFLGRLLGAMGQGPHFVCHYGKTTAGFPSPRGLDGGVQGQQVGLFGNGADHVQHLADFP